MFGKLKTVSLAVALFCGFLLLPLTANATLIGDNVCFERVFQSNKFDQACANVADPSAPEFGIAGVMTVDVTANGFVFLANQQTGFSPSSPHYFTLFDLDWVGEPTGKIVGLNFDFAGYTSPGLNPGLFSFTDNSVTVDVRPLNSIQQGDTFIVSFDTSHAVPEPSVLGLLGLGLLSLGYTRRKQLR